MSEWTSYHIFYFDAQLQEKLLCECIGPMMRNYREEGKIEKWFFIRYWEGGPHIRLRFIDRGEVKKEIMEALRSYLKEHPSHSTLTREQYYKGHTFDGEPIAEEDLPWYGDNAVVPIAYEREYERYGGENAIPYCENIFMKSSEMAVDLIEASGSNLGVRISVAMNLVLTMLDQAQIHPGYFFYHYKNFWDQFFQNKPIQMQYVKRIQAMERLRKIKEQMQGDSLCGRWYAMIEEDMKAIEDIWQSDRNRVYGICVSLVHMFHNRLGIIPDMERQIAAQFVKEMEEAESGVAN